MPPGHHMEGIEAAHAIRRERPGIGVVVLSQHTDETSPLRCYGMAPPAALSRLCCELLASMGSALDDLEVGHHAHVLVFQLVAVDQVDTLEPVESDQDLHCLAVLEQYGVLPSLLPGEELPAPALS